MLSINPENLENLGEAKGTQEAIDMLNKNFSKVFNRTFTDTMIDHGKQGVQVHNVYIRTVQLEHQIGGKLL